MSADNKVVKYTSFIIRWYNFNNSKGGTWAATSCPRTAFRGH